MIGRIALVLTLIAVSAEAAPTVERKIEVNQPGPQRLDVDLPLLARAARNLADLRVYDRAGHEIPYLLIDPPTADPEWLRTRRFVIAPTKTTSGIEADAGGRRVVDALRIEGVEAPFLKRVRVEGSGDRHRWILLADTTVFDLPAESLARTTVEFAPSDLRYLRLTWDDSSSTPVSGTARIVVRVHGSTAPPLPLRAELPFRKRPSEPGRSRYRIQLPGHDLPLRAIELVVPEGDVFRRATVSEPRLAGSEIVPTILGAAQLRQAERNGLIASDNRIVIAPPRTQELDLVIEDERNPPLQLARIVAEAEPQPWIYFEAPAAGQYVARYGGAGESAPRYDLEAARPFVMNTTVATAEWLPPRAAASQARVEPRPLPTVGSAVDRSAFAVARRIAAAPRGMSVLHLDADVLARSRELRDVRLVEGNGRQVPFIVEHLDEPLILDVSVGQRREEPDNVSVYPIAVPYATLPSGTRLVIETSAGVFERNVVLQDAGRGERDAGAIASAVWRHVDTDSEPPPLTFNLPRRLGRRLELRIEEGDNAPLPVTEARLLLPSFAIRFHHPGRPLTLVYDNPSASTPRYDLALLAPRVFREPAQQVTFASSASPGATDDGGIAQHFFWIAIAAVALGLMLLLARLLRPLGESQS